MKDVYLPIIALTVSFYLLLVNLFTYITNSTEASWESTLLCSGVCYER